MADYRRFVAYVYEYQRGKKGDNCGFVKIEIRGMVCRIELHLRCEGLISEAECAVYGFVREKGLLNGVLIGVCKTSENQIEAVLETDTQRMGSSAYTMDQLGGMIFTTDKGGFFGTEWDDQQIRQGDFRPMNVEKKKADDMEISEESSEENDIKKSAEEVPELHTQSISENAAKISSPSTNTLPPPVRVGTPFDAFTDGEFMDCRKITPQDLCHIGRRECMLRNNRFVQYGYYHFGHLLLCRNSCGQQILGVPGGYDQQERFMANMFGFPYFKESPQIQIPSGKGGYWYRLINPADADNRDCCH